MATKAEKEAAKAAAKAAEVKTTAFVMTDEKGKKFKVVAPDDSLDKDGNAESALEGVYRHC